VPLAPSGQVLTNIPSIPFVPNPAAFDANTQRNHHLVLPNITDPGDNGTTPGLQLPQAGIIAGFWIFFTGTLTVTLGAGSATSKGTWPYGWIKNLDFFANFQNSILHMTGQDLHAHRFITNPAMNTNTGVDSFGAGTVGGTAAAGGGDVITGGAKAVDLAWYVPVTADLASLIGAIYAQSAQNLIQAQITRAPVSDLITLAGGATAVWSNESFSLALDTYDIPRDPQTGAVLTPDISRIHGINYLDTPITQAGTGIKVPLVPMNGNLLRVMLRIQSADGTSFSPRQPDNSGWTGVTLHYGGNKNPQQWDLRSLVNKNAQQYGGRVPYNYVVLDFMRENPVRDSVVMPGLTDLALLIDIAAGTTIPAGTVAHVVQETLYS
jgi:hypothetical protein